MAINIASSLNHSENDIKNGDVVVVMVPFPAQGHISVNSFISLVLFLPTIYQSIMFALATKLSRLNFVFMVGILLPLLTSISKNSQIRHLMNSLNIFQIHLLIKPSHTLYYPYLMSTLCCASL